MPTWTDNELAKIAAAEELEIAPLRRFPRFGRNSNSGGEVASEAADQYRPAINRIFHDAAHPSCLILPMIER
jgi:predicted acyl esterase